MTRQAELERSDAADAVPLLDLAAPLIGHFQIRNRGTVGGSNRARRSAGELPTVALALDCELDVVSTAGTRTVAASELFAGRGRRRSAGGAADAVRFPVWPGRSGFAVDEVARRYGDFALAGVACGVELDADGVVLARCYRSPRLGSMPLRASAAEAAIVGRGAIRRRALGDRPASRWPISSRRPTSHASGEYRRRSVRTSWRAVSAPPGEGRRMKELPVSFVANGEPYRPFVEPARRWPTACARTAGSRVPTSAASTAYVAPARCSSTRRGCGRA